MARQLSLFKGRRQRGVEPPPPKELGLHIALEQLLRVNCNPAWRYTHIPNGEERDKRVAAKLKAMGVKRGWPDFLFVGPDRRVVGLELKREGEDMTDEQLAIGTHFSACGFAFCCTSRLDVAIGMLRDLGIVRARVAA